MYWSSEYHKRQVRGATCASFGTAGNRPYASKLVRLRASLIIVRLSQCSCVLLIRNLASRESATNLVSAFGHDLDDDRRRICVAFDYAPRPQSERCTVFCMRCDFSQHRKFCRAHTVIEVISKSPELPTDSVISGQKREALLFLNKLCYIVCR